MPEHYQGVTDAQGRRNTDRMRRIIIQMVDDYIASLEDTMREYVMANSEFPNAFTANSIADFAQRIRVMQEFRQHQVLRTTQFVPQEFRASPTQETNAT